MTHDAVYNERKQFFNDHAEKWIDMWYRDPQTGEEKKHAKDFERLFSLIPLKPGNCVLDARCGTGILVPFILQAIGKTGLLFEVDFAEKMIETNRRLHPDGNVRFIVSDIEHAPLADEFCDAVIFFSCFPHFHDKKAALRAIHRILKPQGKLVIAHFDSSEGINHHHKSCRAVMHDQLPGGDAMRTMLAAGGFDIEQFTDEKGFYYLQVEKNRKQL